MATEIIATESYREARLDFVVAQELHCDPEFAAWLWEQAGGAAGPPARVDVQMNVDHTGPDIPDDAHGETDVHVTLTWNDGTSSVLLIEDKVWAPSQPRQAERYRLRADALGGKALLIAPRARNPKPEDTDPFDALLEIEALADWLGKRDDDRQRWLAKVLGGLTQRREPAEGHPPTEKFTKYCVDWFQKHAPIAVPRVNSLRTAGQGWLDFETPAALTYKVTGLVRTKDAMVDLYLSFLGLDADAASRVLAHRPCVVEREDGTEGRFELAHDSKGNVVLRYLVSKLNPAAGVPTDGELVEVLHNALRACVAAAAWADAVANS